MQSKYTSLYALLLVVGIHAGLLASLVLSAEEPTPPEIIPPSIQGMIVMAEPKQELLPPPPPPPPPPPEKKPEPKPQPKPKPLPKAPPSERAVKAPEPEPEPPAPPPAPPVAAAPAPAPAPIVPPNADAAHLNNPAPTYPSISRRLREQGVVTLEIFIRADGSVGEVRLKQSSGYKRLDDAALNTVTRWRFQPATQAGVAIDYWYEQPLEFTLH